LVEQTTAWCAGHLINSPDNMTPTTSLLARALCGDLSWEASEEFDVSQLVDAAEDHGVAPLLWQALESTRGRGLQVRDALAYRVRAAATADVFVQRDIQVVLAALATAGVRGLVIKGSALAYTVYLHPWLRPRTDTDLLVSYGEVPAAIQALERCGYTRSDALTSGTLVSHQIAFERVDEHDVHHVVDLHWKIVNPQVLADSLLFDDLWAEALPAPALGPTARVPARLASVVLGCIHRLAHHQGHDRLIWLYDLRLLTAGFDDAEWRALGRLACSSRVAGLCLDGLRQARSRLGAHLHEDLEATLATAAPAEPSQQYLQGAVRKRDVLLSDLRRLKSWRARLRLLREHAFPPVTFIRQRYGINNPLLTPALYVHRLVTGVYRWGRP